MTEPTNTPPVPCANIHAGPPCELGSTATALPDVNLTCTVGGTGTLTVDGHDLTEMVAAGGVTIQVGNGRDIPTRVYVELIAGASYDGPAQVHIIQGAHATEFLQSVNPDALAKAALAAGFNHSPIAAALEVLIGMAQAIDTGQEPVE